MLIIGLKVELFLPACTSLKDKRKVIRSLRDRLIGKYHAAVAESAFQDLHQRSEFAIAIVGGSPAELRNREQAVLREIRESLGLQLLSANRIEVAAGDLVAVV